jgi:hypothetical protein
MNNIVVKNGILVILGKHVGHTSFRKKVAPHASHSPLYRHYLFVIWTLTLWKILPPKRRSVIRLRFITQSTVKASKIAHHKPQHSTVDIGRICSNQFTNPSAISQWVRWLMGFMVSIQRWRQLYSNLHYNIQKLVKASMSKAWWT